VVLSLALIGSGSSIFSATGLLEPQKQSNNKPETPQTHAQQHPKTPKSLEFLLDK